MAPRPHTFGIKSVAVLGALGALLTMTACAPTLKQTGYLQYDANPATDIAVGDTEAAVLDKLGTPSQTSLYDPTEWYYVDQVSMKMTYKQPKVTSRNVTVVKFDKDAKTVASVKTLTLADGRALTPAQEKTPTRGRSLTALEQVLGTVGQQRIDNSRDSDPGRQRRRE